MTTPSPTAPTRLTDEQFAALLAESTKPGQSSRMLAAWLKTAFGVTVSHAWVIRQLKEHREERREATQAVMVEAMAPHVTSDLDILQRRRDEIEAAIGEILAAGKGEGKKTDWTQYRLLVALQVRVVDRRLYYAGAGPDPTKETLGDFFRDYAPGTTVAPAGQSLGEADSPKVLGEEPPFDPPDE